MSDDKTPYGDSRNCDNCGRAVIYPNYNELAGYIYCQRAACLREYRRLKRNYPREKPV